MTADEQANSDATELTDAESEATELTGAESDTATDEPAQGPTADNGSGRDGVVSAVMRGARRNVVVILIVIALLASAGVASWLYFTQYRVDTQTDAHAADVALEAATSGSVALLSYSPESLEQDFANAKSKLTGEFLTYYTQFTEQIVTPAAKEKDVKTAASVVRAAVSEITPDSAEVLVFINQTTTSKENPDGAFAASSVKVGLTKVDGRWLIDAFDPV
ncbi:hypothetical protein [Mycolicibacterium sp. XJ1819]